MKTIRMHGLLAVQNAQAIQAQILEAFDQADEIRIDVSDATEIDVSFLQLLVAAQRTAKAEGKFVRLQTGDTPLLAARAALCGIDLSLLPACV